MSNPTHSSDPLGEGADPRGSAYDAPLDYTDPQSGYQGTTTGATDPYGTSVPYEPVDPNAPAAGGGYATTGTTGTVYTPIEDTTGSYAPSGGSPSTTDVAKDEASAVTDTAKGEAAAVAGSAKDEAVNVKDTAVGAGKQVASTAKAEAANVAGEAKQQARSLLSSATSEIKSQASTQQSRLATTLRGYTDQLQGVTQGQGLEEGPLSDLVQQLASRGNTIVSWLENREPADVLEELRRFARRRPVLFLVLAGAAGVVAGRVARGAVAANTSVDSPGSTRSIESSYSYTPSTTTDVTSTTYATSEPAYSQTGSTYGAYTDAPAGGYTDVPATDYTTQPTYADPTPAGYTDRGDPVR